MISEPVCLCECENPRVLHSVFLHPQRIHSVVVLYGSHSHNSTKIRRREATPSSSIVLFLKVVHSTSINTLLFKIIFPCDHVTENKPSLCFTTLHISSYR